MKFRSALFALLLVLPASAVASTYHLLLERDIDLPGQTDLFLVSFPTLDDLVGSTGGAVTATQIPLAADFSLGGFAFDGAYHLLLERDIDLPGQTDLFLVSFPTLDDLVGSTGGAVTATQIPLAADFSLGGFAYGGFPPVVPPPPEDPPSMAVIPLPASAILLIGALAAMLGVTRIEPQNIGPAPV